VCVCTYRLPHGTYRCTHRCGRGCNVRAGKYQEAEEAQRRGICIVETLFGTNHVKVAIVRRPRAFARAHVTTLTASPGTSPPRDAALQARQVRPVRQGVRAGPVHLRGNLRLAAPGRRRNHEVPS
jgi:hypothetical protein